MQGWQITGLTFGTLGLILTVLTLTGVITVSHLNPIYPIICIAFIGFVFWMSIRRHIFWRYILQVVKLRLAKITHRKYKGAKRITSCRNPTVLHETLRRAAGTDLNESEISPKGAFKRWTSLNGILFRIQEDVWVSETVRPAKNLLVGAPQGFYSIFRITTKAFSELCDSVLDYDDISDAHLAPAHEEGWLFILDFELITAKGYNPSPIYLLCDLLIHIRFKIAQDQKTKGIAALVATTKGERFARDLGFSQFENYIQRTGVNWKLYHKGISDLLTLIDKIPAGNLRLLDECGYSSYLIDERLRTATSGIFQVYRREMKQAI